MNSTDYENTAKAWQFVEKESLTHEGGSLRDIRRRAVDAGFPQASAAQATFLGLQAKLVGAKSVILVGTGSLVEAHSLIASLGSEGSLTLIDSTAKGADIARANFGKLSEQLKTRLRVVNAPVEDYLNRLNADDYDLIVVGGEAENYRCLPAAAVRLLRSGGLLILLDALALFRNPEGGLTNPADRSDKAVSLRALLSDLSEQIDFDLSLVPVGTGLLLAIKH